MRLFERVFAIVAGAASIVSLLHQFWPDLVPLPISLESWLKISYVLLPLTIVFIVYVTRSADATAFRASLWFPALLALIIGYAGWFGWQVRALADSQYTDLPPSSSLAVAAWSALLNDDSALALTEADICIKQFEPQAVQIQQGLLAKQEPQLLTGADNSNEMRTKVFSQVVLNDVAACYFIRGEAFRKSARITEAKESYQGDLRFPHARVLDPYQNLFWSPAQRAAEILATLQ